MLSTIRVACANCSRAKLTVCASNMRLFSIQTLPGLSFLYCIYIIVFVAVTLSLHFLVFFFFLRQLLNLHNLHACGGPSFLGIPVCVHKCKLVNGDSERFCIFVYVRLISYCCITWLAFGCAAHTHTHICTYMYVLNRTLQCSYAMSSPS